MKTSGPASCGIARAGGRVAWAARLLLARPAPEPRPGGPRNGRPGADHAGKKPSRDADEVPPLVAVSESRLLACHVDPFKPA